MSGPDRRLLTGDEAVALAARESGVALGTGYPGTPSTEILETFSALGGRAQWAPNEKVALEVALGAAFAGARVIATMKHVGLNVAADPLFTAAYTGVAGALVLVSADDPGMASSQNEQDNRRYAVAAAVPMLEPADAQDAYEFTAAAIALSERWHLPVLLRMTTRCCHSKSIVRCRPLPPPPAAPRFDRDIAGRVMIPANARPAHRRLRQKLAEIAAWNESRTGETPGSLNRIIPGDSALGIIASGAAWLHAREAAPIARFLQLGLTHPLPIESIRAFAASVKRCVVIEEGDPYLADAIRAAGVPVESKPEMYRFGELTVARVRRILAGDASPEPAPAPGKPPQLCPGCAHRYVFEALHQLDCIVAGDIGCYTLGVLPPFEAMDTCVCMGASIGVGLGLRHVLPADQARRVVSVIGDSTFVHSGITGLVEMIYNPPPTGHVVLILDNSTTAMTGHQEHPGTGRTLEHEPTGKVSFEALAKSLGIPHVHVIDPARPAAFQKLLQDSLANGQLNVIVARRPCVLVAGKIQQYERAADANCEACDALENPGDDMADRVTNIVVAGLGGQGVIKASDIVADALFRAGFDVKKSELHGMSQRGGSVSSDVRFGREVFSPMVPEGEADYLVVAAADQVEVHRRQLRPGGVLIAPDAVDAAKLANKKSLNVALLGVLSRHLGVPESHWREAIDAAFPEKLRPANHQAFDLGRNGG